MATEIAQLWLANIRIANEKIVSVISLSTFLQQLPHVTDHLTNMNKGE